MFETMYVSSLIIVLFFIGIALIVKALPQPISYLIIRAFKKYMWEGETE